MKSKISLSQFSIVLTSILCGALLIGYIVIINEPSAFYTLLGIYILLFCSILFFAPLYIKSDSDSITLGCILRKHKLQIQNIESVELFQPTMGAYRICASGGFCGYWGIFKGSDIGRYYAFYGKASDCFLIRMKNGKQYVLGCNNPSEMVNYIKSQISDGE